MTVEEDVDSLLQKKDKKVVVKHFKFNKRNFLIGFGSMVVTALLFTMLVVPASREWMQETFFSAREETVSSLGDSSTYYFDSYNEGKEEWTSNPGYMIDGNIETPANTASDGDVELLTTSTYVSGGSGNIVSVEIRAHGSWEGSLSTYQILLRPVFTGGDGDNHTFTLPEGEPDWSSWYNITTDTNAPSPWTWTDVANLDCDVEANLTGDGNIFCSKVELKVINTSDADPPAVAIKFAGNYSDSGGPYWEPPDETIQLVGSYSEGYYVNDSRQHEGWVNVTINATDATGVGDVWLNWLNETTWINWTYRFTYAGSDIYYINTSQNFSTAEGYNYSFNVVVNDTASPVNSQTVAWNKTGSDGSTYIRRYIQMNCSDTDSLDYRIMYLWNATFSTGGDEYDVLHHDGGFDTVLDAGYMLNSIPDDDNYTYRACLAFVWFWFDDSVCIPSSSIKDITYHIWWDSTASHDGDVNMTWDTNRTILLGQSKEYKISLRANNKSGELELMPGYKYVLSTEYIDITDESYTDNSIYEFGVVFHGVGPTAGMWIYSNRSALSYVIINLPDNATLNASHADTDSDSLSDWTELYVTYTNPFLADTDNDGVSDYHEVLSGSDPNNYTDTIEYKTWQVINNTYNGSLFNQSQVSVISNIINGSLYNQSQYSIISSSINGSLYNISQFSVFSSDINGSIYNISIYTIIDSSVNGSLFNTSQFSVLSNVYNGSIYNTSQFSIFSSDINGSIYNQTQFYVINNTYNGSLYNASQTTIFSNIVNGSLFNTSQVLLINNSINGSLYNGSGGVFSVINNSVNGTVYNGTGIVEEWVIIEPGVYFDVDSNNDRYGVNQIMAFTQIWINDTWIKFNETSFNITFGSFVNTSLTHIDDNPNNNTADELVCGFWTNSSSGTVWFNISGFNSSSAFYVNVNGTHLNNYDTNATGVLSFSNSRIGNRLYEIYNGTVVGWQIITNSINGSIYNQSQFSVFSSDINGSVYNSSQFIFLFSNINGSLWNISAFSIFSNSINGSLYNQSQYSILFNNINGSLWNSSIYITFSSNINGSIYNLSAYTLVNSTINGSIYNVSQYSIFSNDINGSIWNSSAYVTFLSDINGSIYNLTQYIIISNIYNGSIYNTSQYQLISDAINGSIWNVSQVTLFSSDLNGSIYNLSIYTIISNTINGSLFNASQYTLLFNNINGSLWNLSAYTEFSNTINGVLYNSSPFTIIQNDINGSLYNVTPPELDVTLEYPANGSNILVTQPALFFNLTNPTGATMNYSIYYGNSSSLCNTLLDSNMPFTNVGNGTYHYDYYTATNFSINYWWRVAVTDGTNSINETFYFQSLRQGGGGAPSRLGTAVAMGVLAGLAGSIIFGLLFVKKKKERWR